MFNQQFQFMAILAPDGTVLDANETCFRATGVEESQVVGLLLWETPWWNRHPEAQQWWKNHVSEVSCGGAR